MTDEHRPKEGTYFDLYDDLVGVSEIAKNLNVTIYRVKRWIERRASTNCPRPVRVLRIGHIYSMTEWRAWFALWRITRGPESWWHK